MFTEIRNTMQAIEEILITSKGYDFADVKSIKIGKADISLTFSAWDTFQENVPTEHKVKQFTWDNLNGETLNDLLSKIYALPSRPMRELEVLAKQLTGITGMEAQLQSIVVKKMLLPLLEQRDELCKLLAPAEPVSNEVTF